MCTRICSAQVLYCPHAWQEGTDLEENIVGIGSKQTHLRFAETCPTGTSPLSDEKRSHDSIRI